MERPQEKPFPTPNEIKDYYTKYLFEKNKSLQSKVERLQNEVEELKKKLGI